MYFCTRASVYSFLHLISRGFLFFNLNFLITYPLLEVNTVAASSVFEGYTKYLYICWERGIRVINARTICHARGGYTVIVYICEFA